MSMNRPAVRVFVAVLFVLAALCLLSVAEGTPSETETTSFPSRVERLRGLAEVWGMVYYFHPALADPQKQAAWESELLIAIPEVEAAETTEEYALALQRMIAKLGDTHTQLLLPNELYELKFPITLAYVDGRTLVSEIDPGFIELDVPILGSELLAVNDVSVAAYLEQWLPYASGETLSLKREWIYGKLLSDLPGTEIRLLFASHSGARTDVTICIPEFADLVSGDSAIESRLDSDNLLWVRIPSLWAMTRYVDGQFTGMDLSDYYGSIASISQAEGIVLDLRTDGRDFGQLYLARTLLPIILGRFTTDDWTTSLGPMMREHRGLVSDPGAQYPSPFFTGWRSQEGVIMASSLDYILPFVVLVDSQSYTVAMPYLQPLQQLGRAVIMGNMGSEPVWQPYIHSLPGDLSLLLRLEVASDFLCANRGIVPVESVGVLAGGRDATLAAALAVLKDWENRGNLALTSPPELGLALAGAGFDFASNHVSREGRLLGLFRLWNAVNYFYAYPDRIDGDWTALLEEFIPIIEEAQTEADYAKELQRLLVHLQDGHGLMLGLPWSVSPIPPLDIQKIEGSAIVVNPMSIRTELGMVKALPPGQVILEVNGVPVEEVLSDRLETSPGATQAHRDYRAYQWLLAEIEEGDIDLLLRNEFDEPQLVQICRSCPYSEHQESIEPWWFEKGIAYVDICSIEMPDYASIESDLRDAEGILIDLRGYPQAGMMNAMADLVFAESTPYLQGRVPVVATPDPLVQEWHTRCPTIGFGSSEGFEGSIVVLTNVFATSRAETVCMIIKESGKAMFVGETTSGTNGDVTEVRLPYGLSAIFSGSEISYVDGSPFQGIGIIPDVEVHPTIQGIREGRDEILEKGLEVLQEMIEQRKGS
jgi:C-terminal processing protease CtpA/Prc